MSGEKRIATVPGPVDIQGALEDVVQLIGEPAGACAVAGGVAMGVHGFVRYTKDLDLACTAALIARIAPSIEARDPKELRIGGLSFSSRVGVRVDLIQRRDGYAGLYANAIREAQRRGPVLQVGGHELPVVTAPYLIAMKVLAGRPQDDVDVIALLRDPQLDYEAVREVAVRELGRFAGEYVDRLARKAGRQDVRPEYGPEDS